MNTLGELRLALGEVADSGAELHSLMEHFEAEMYAAKDALSGRPPMVPEAPVGGPALTAPVLWFQMILAGSDKGFRSLDTFVGWFVGGTGAAVALILANLDKLSFYLKAVDLTFVLTLVIYAFVAVVIAKFIGSLICTAAGSAEKGDEIMQAWRDRNVLMPTPSEILEARDAAMPWPIRYASKVIGQDPTVIARRVSWGLMSAGLLSIVAAILVGVALVHLATGIDFRAAPPIVQTIDGAAKASSANRLEKPGPATDAP